MQGYDNRRVLSRAKIQFAECTLTFDDPDKTDQLILQADRAGHTGREVKLRRSRDVERAICSLEFAPVALARQIRQQVSWRLPGFARSPARSIFFLLTTTGSQNVPCGILESDRAAD